MNIEQLKYVMAIVKHQHLTNASYEVSISQSSLSKYLKKVEEELGGVQLFDRTTRNVKLTAAGQEFSKYASRIIAEYENMMSAMEEFTSLERGGLSVGTIPVYSSRGFSSLFTSFQKKYPGIQLEIKEKLTNELIDLLKKSELDMAIIALPFDMDPLNTFTTYPMIEDEVVLITHKSHPFAKRRSINLSEAADQNFILINHASTLYQICIDACKEAGFTPKITYESSQIDMVAGLVEEGLGVSLITLREAESSVQSNIAIVRLDTSIKHTTALAIRSRLNHSNAMKAFVKHSLEWSETRK
jgi:LysR family transcriptional regulator, transcription activator of glutamate synthase operon